MSDFDCPYCGAAQEVCYDDGHGCADGEWYEEECSECGKNFMFDTGIIFVHEAWKADCLNGGDHNYKPVKHFPMHFPDWKRCADCGHEVRGQRKEETP